MNGDGDAKTLRLGEMKGCTFFWKAHLGTAISTPKKQLNSVPLTPVQLPRFNLVVTSLDPSNYAAASNRRCSTHRLGVTRIISGE
jgi:hypothetical protein